MRIEGKNEEERLHFFQDAYESVKKSLTDEIERLDICMRQYKGDASVGIEGGAEVPSVVRNITYELIESQINSDIPAPQVDAAKYTRSRVRNAKSVERLCARVTNKLPFEDLNDRDERYARIFGGSIWMPEWDESIRTYNESGGIRVTLLSPQDFFPQPNIYREEDLDYFFARFTTTKAAIERQYEISPEALDHAQLETDSEAFNETRDHTEDDTVTVVVCYYKDEQGIIGRFVWTGETVLSDISDYYARRVRRCQVCHKVEALCQCEEPDIVDEEQDAETLYRDVPLSYKKEDGTQAVILHMTPIVNDDGTVDSEDHWGAMRETNGHMAIGPDGLPVVAIEKEAKKQNTKLPYYRPKTLPVVVRRNTSQDKRMLGQSDCEFIRCQQLEINKLETRIQQKRLRAGIMPMMPEDARVTINNSVFGNVIKLREGEKASDYGVLDTTPDISGDVMQAERLYEQAKRILGISDSYQGQADNTAKSGVAKQAQIQQAAGRLESKRCMKQSAYAKLYRLIFELHLAFADEPRPVVFFDHFGITHNDSFNRYDFYEYDESTGEFYVEDDYLFSIDRSGGPEQDRASMWEINLQNLQNGALGNPQDPRTLLLYWRKQEKCHYPCAHENVEYFQSLIEEQEKQIQMQQMAGLPGLQQEGM